MKIGAFLAELKQLSPEISIRVAPANPEMSGVYWRDLYICGMPSNDIFDDVKRDYKNSAGIPHRTRPVVIAQVKKYLWRLANEPDFMEGELAFMRENK